MTDRDILRRRALRSRAAIPAHDRCRLSQLIGALLLAREEYRQAEVVMAYASFRDEVQTPDIIRQALANNKVVVLPVTSKGQRRLDPRRISDPNELIAGEYGIPEPPRDAEPVDPRLIDLCLVPGVAFDLRGGRLGYGAGYYDRFLVRLRPDAIRIALAFGTQLVPSIPLRTGDEPVDMVITELRAIITGARGEG